VYHEQDADEYGDFVVFLKVDPKLNVSELQEAAKKDKQFILIDSKNPKCRCLLKKEPASHARLPFVGWTIGRWEIMRQISACFQLLRMSVFPAVDTISDLIYILSSIFANHYLFFASLCCITSQFWLFIGRLKKRRVFEAFKERKIDKEFLFEHLKKFCFWPKWAPTSSLPFKIVYYPILFIYHVIFPFVWFLLGYAIYSFQLFPISRISNRWLYAFV
jgi:hypothetical protein